MKKALTVLLFLTIALFSYWLMAHSLSQNPSGLLVGGKYWSDFGAQLPLIRSFTFGANWPPEHPLFPGEPIKYHFLFYLLVSAWEALGVPISLALNIPSALGLFFLSALIWLLSFKLFRSYYVSFLATLFIFFNGSLSWIEFLKNHSLADLPQLTAFPGFGPWNGSLIAAFWNLNIYTNQRHLAYSFVLVILLIYFLYAQKKQLLLLTGTILGVLLLLNQPAAAIAGLFVLSFFIFTPQIRRSVLLSAFGFLPGLFMYLTFVSSPSAPHLAFGFLQSKPITAASFFTYWFANFGPHLLLIPLGLLFSLRKSKAFLLPLLILFIVPNVWQFSPDLINNHKFFNFFLLIGGIFSAYAISRFKMFGLLIIPLVVLGGVVDIFPIKNDNYYTLSDYPQNPDIEFFKNNTPHNSVVLNSTWFYHPASLAGRKIYNGYSYFTWSYGYDQVTRENKAKSIYSSPSKQLACLQLIDEHIDYVELSISPETFLEPNYNLWNSEFRAIYTNPQSIRVVSVADNCL